MRLSPRCCSPRLLIVAASLALPITLLAQRYDSTSPQEVQRRLERDTDALIENLRSQRNSSLGSARFDANSNPWVQQLRAQEGEKKAARANWIEQQRLDAEWAEDHPDETRQQYAARKRREAAAEAKRERECEIAEERAAIERANREAELRQKKIVWENIRRWSDYYAPREEPPLENFPSAAAALAWMLEQDRRVPNQWSAVNSAILLIDGLGVPRDLDTAAALVDPGTRRSRPADDPIRPQSLALHAYLGATHPEIYAKTGMARDRVESRRDLEKLAETNELAQWYLARLLADSPVPADQKRALELLGPAHLWASQNIGEYYTAPAREEMLLRLGKIANDLAARNPAAFAEGARTWGIGYFEMFACTLPQAPEPARGALLKIAADLIAERAVPLVPARQFDYLSFSATLAAAGDAGSPAAHALAVMERFKLIQPGNNAYSRIPDFVRLNDLTLTLEALTAWAKRDDTLGARSRLALAALSLPNATDPGLYLQPLDEAVALARKPDDAALRQQLIDAVVRRDLAAPPISDLPFLLGEINAAGLQKKLLADYKAAMTAGPASPFLAVTHASFKLADAAATLDAAFAPGTKAGAYRTQLLFQAASQGDALASYAFAHQPGFPGTAEERGRLEKLFEARRARDETAGLPRALLTEALLAARQSEDASALFAAAAKAGSSLAAARLLDDRIASSMARENDRSPSWNLDPALVAELDAAVMALNAKPGTFADWSVVQALSSESEAANSAGSYLSNIAFWDIDRQERIADAALSKAIQPQVDAVIATLAQWPGINQDDPLRKEWTAAAERDREQAEESIRNGDGLTACRLFLTAAGRGDRGALELLGRHIRDGDGGLPRSVAIADQIQAASFQMTVTDAEVGDAFAANYLGESYAQGRGITADSAKATEWLVYAVSIGSVDAARTLASDRAEGLSRPASEIFHWEAVREAMEYGEYLPKPARRILGERTDIAPVRAQLEASAATFASFRNKKPQELSDAENEKQSARWKAAEAELAKNPHNGLVLLAKVVAEDNAYAAHDLIRILARGEYNLRPSPELAQRYYALVLANLERTSEYGDKDTAHRLGRYALGGLNGAPDIQNGLRWLTYAAELGNDMSTQLLGHIYTEGIPGITPDEKQASHWAGIEEKIADESFKPRKPLKH